MGGIIKYREACFFNRIQKLATDSNEEEKEGGTWRRKGAPAVRWRTSRERRRPAVKIRVGIGRGKGDLGLIRGREIGEPGSVGRGIEDVPAVA